MLTDEEISKLFSNSTGFDMKLNDLAIESFARAIERAVIEQCLATVRNTRLAVFNKYYVSYNYALSDVEEAIKLLMSKDDK